MEVAHFSEIIVYFYQTTLLHHRKVTLNILCLCTGTATDKALFNEVNAGKLGSSSGASDLHLGGARFVSWPGC
jgi:hypothetical protein